MNAHLTEDLLSAAVRDRSRALAHDRQLARLLAARRWDRVAEAAARRARLLRSS